MITDIACYVIGSIDLMELKSNIDPNGGRVGFNMHYNSYTHCDVFFGGQNIV